VEKIFNDLSHQIFDALFFQSGKMDSAQTRIRARSLTYSFLNRLQYIKQLMSSDVKAMFDSDPAAKNIGEVIFCYPAIKAISNYRIAHELYLLDVPLIPRIITELAHAETGIDIHPGAEIGEYFSIDHGTGVVIGQTTIIGNHVTLYQGVTLGAKRFTLDEEGYPKDVPRHPILEDGVTVYSNASILGRITIGRGTVIGGNIWLDHSVPPNSRILQTKYS
jgi:serine O-acetyltransferase